MISQHTSNDKNGLARKSFSSFTFPYIIVIQGRFWETNSAVRYTYTEGNPSTFDRERKHLNGFPVAGHISTTEGMWISPKGRQMFVWHTWTEFERVLTSHDIFYIECRTGQRGCVIPNEMFNDQVFILWRRLRLLRSGRGYRQIIQMLVFFLVRRRNSTKRHHARAGAIA